MPHSMLGTVESYSIYYLLGHSAVPRKHVYPLRRFQSEVACIFRNGVGRSGFNILGSSNRLIIRWETVETECPGCRLLKVMRYPPYWCLLSAQTNCFLHGTLIDGFTGIWVGVHRRATGACNGNGKPERRH